MLDAAITADGHIADALAEGGMDQLGDRRVRRAHNGAMDPSATLRDHLDQARSHVLASVHGLSDEQLAACRIPSGWSMNTMLSHLLWDDEIFWLGAVLLGDPKAIEQVRDGWASPEPTGAALIEQYQVVTEAHRRQLADLDLDLPPRWWPAPETFGGAQFETGWQVVHRALAETSTHAGHLDIARELIDGHQHLVLG